MKPDELKAILEKPSVARRNPDLCGKSALEMPKPTKPAPALDRDIQIRPEREICVAVWIIGIRRRLLDDDNFAAGNKPLRDAIAETIGIDDGDPRIKFYYCQIKTTGVSEDTLVRIEATL